MTPMHRTIYHACKQEERRQERWSKGKAAVFIFTVSFLLWLPAVYHSLIAIGAS